MQTKLINRILLKNHYKLLCFLKIVDRPAVAPETTVAIVGVRVLKLIRARNLKSNPSSAMA